MKKRQLVLVKVSGPDKPGITFRLVSVIAEGGGSIVDMGQSVTHGLLSLSILISLKSEKDDHHVIKDLLFEAKHQHLALDFDIVEDNHLDQHENDNGKFILSCVSIHDLTAAFIRDVAQALSSKSINILRIDKVGTQGFKSLEITTTVPKGLEWEGVKKELMSISSLHKVDMAFLRDNVFRRNKRLIVFDMDSTLIQAEVIDELGVAAGVGDQIKRITELAMNGKMNFDESLKQRVIQLKGLPVSTLQEILERLPLTSGAEEFIRTVKGLGYKVALISGGFSFFAYALKEKLGLDFAFANELEIIDGKLTGNLIGPIVNAEQKALLVKLLAQQMGIHLEQVVAIGDGANDLPMLATAGLGIAFHAKEIVKEKAGQHMSHGPMTSILYFLGIPGPQFN
jgi:phosphoserine phosphatase